MSLASSGNWFKKKKKKNPEKVISTGLKTQSSLLGSTQTLRRKDGWALFWNSGCRIASFTSSPTRASCLVLITGSISEPQCLFFTQFCKFVSFGSCTCSTCLVPVPSRPALPFSYQMLQGTAAGRQNPVCCLLAMQLCEICPFLISHSSPVGTCSAGLLWCKLLFVFSNHLQSVIWLTGHSVLPAILDPFQSLLLIRGHLAGPSQPGPSLQSGRSPSPGLCCSQSSQATQISSQNCSSWCHLVEKRKTVHCSLDDCFST